MWQYIGYRTWDGRRRHKAKLLYIHIHVASTKEKEGAKYRELRIWHCGRAIWELSKIGGRPSHLEPEQNGGRP